MLKEKGWKKAMAFLLVEELEKASEEKRHGGRLEEIEVTRILKNPAQPRTEFDEAGLAELADSIREHGILQPPVVRPLGGGMYELIAGERRLRAACLAGLSRIRCLVEARDEEESAALALVENLQRRDLSMFEEATALAALCERHHLTQEELGRRLSVSQSYVANKLRLLRLSEEAREVMRRGNLTERHARAALRLPEEGRLPALRQMAQLSMNVAAAESYVERLLADCARAKPRRGIIKDLRLFYNSIDRAVSLCQAAGIGVVSERRESEDCIEVVIRIDRRKKE